MYDPHALVVNNTCLFVHRFSSVKFGRAWTKCLGSRLRSNTSAGWKVAAISESGLVQPCERRLLQTVPTSLRWPLVLQTY